MIWLAPMRGLRLPVTLLLVIAVSITSCDRDIDPPRSGDETGERRKRTEAVIALVGTMSGPGSWRGPDAREGARLAVSDLNQSPLGSGLRWRLTVHDDRGRPRRSTRLVELAARRERTAGIVYAGTPRALPAAQETLERAGVPAFLCYGDLVGAGRLTDHVFQAGPPFVWQARLLVARALKDQTAGQVGALLEHSLMGRTAGQALKGALANNGKKLVATRTFAPGRWKGLPGALEDLRRGGVDTLFVEATVREFRHILEAFLAMRPAASATSVSGWRPRLFVFDLAVGPTWPMPPDGITAAESGARATFLPGSAQRFRRRFVQRWHHFPLGWQRRSYESVRLIAAARAGAEDDADLATALELGGVERIGSSVIRFSSRDHVTPERKSLSVWTTDAGTAARRGLPDRMTWMPRSAR